MSTILVILLSLGTNYWHLHILCFCVFIDKKFLRKISICLKFGFLDLEWDFLLLIFNSALNSLPIYRLVVEKREIFVFDSLFLMQWWHWDLKSFQKRTLLWTMRMIVTKNVKRYSSLNLFTKSICSIFIIFSYRENCT